MSERLTRALAQLRLPSGELTAAEIADIVWLTGVAPPLAPPGAPTERTVQDERTGGESEREGPAPQPRPEIHDRSVRERLPGDSVYPPLAPAPARGARPAAKVRFPTPPPSRLPNALELSRSLRLFRQVTRTGEPQADIDASVQATAEAGRPVVVGTRARVRALDAVLLVDDSLSMQVWRRTFAQFAQVLAQTGSFRTVSCLSMRVSDSEVLISDSGTFRHPPARIIDPSGSRLVLVATDGVSDGWYGPAIWEALRTWTKTMPTALIQTLPPRYWPHTAVGSPAVLAQSAVQPKPNAAYTSTDLLGQPLFEAGIPVPLLRLAPGVLRTWADATVTGQGWAESIIAEKPAAPRPGEINKHLSEIDRVRSFLNRASPPAVRLARALAYSATLTPPLAEVLQRLIVPEGGVTAQAEVFVSGLVDRFGDGYRFREKAARQLRQGVPSAERWRIFDALSDYLSSRPGFGGDIMLRIAHQSGLDSISEHERPIARYFRELAIGLGMPAGPLPDDQPGLAEIEEQQDWPAAMWEQAFGRPERSRQPALAAVAVPRRIATTEAAAVLSEAIARLDRDDLTVTEVHQLGLEVFVVSRNTIGVPNGKQRQYTAQSVSAADGPDTVRLMRAARLRTTGSHLLICTSPGSPWAEQALKILHQTSPRTLVVKEAGLLVRELLRDAIADGPLTQRYALYALAHDPETWRLRPRPQPLFDIGARRGDQTRLELRCEPGDPEGTALAVIAQGRDHRNWAFSVQSMAAPAGIHQVTATLRKPGIVTFSGAPGLTGGLIPDPRPWRELRDRVPRRFYLTPESVHMVFGVERSGPAGQVAERINRVRQLVSLLSAELSGRVEISLLSYGPHAFDYQGRAELPVLTEGWGLAPAAALLVLDQILARGADPIGYPEAAMVEDMLDEVDRRLPPSGVGRIAVVTVGTRPPHPPRVGSATPLPCQARPHRLDWRATLGRLLSRQGLRLGAICDEDRDDAHPSWHELGGHAFASLESADVRWLAAELDIIPDERQSVPFPLVAWNS